MSIHNSHGAYTARFKDPHEMHTEPSSDLQAQETQALLNQPTPRSQRRHPSSLSEPTSDTSRKMCALFFISLLTSNDPTSSFTPKLTGRSPEPKNDPQEQNPSTQPTLQTPNLLANVSSVDVREACPQHLPQCSPTNVATAKMVVDQSQVHENALTENPSRKKRHQKTDRLPALETPSEPIMIVKPIDSSDADTLFGRIGRFISRASDSLVPPQVSAHTTSNKPSGFDTFNPDDEDTILAQVTQGSLDIITVAEWLRGNAPAGVEKLMAKYTSAVERVRPILVEAMDSQVQTTLESALARVPPSQRIQDTSRLKFSLLETTSDIIATLTDLRPLHAFAMPSTEGYHATSNIGCQEDFPPACSDPDPRTRIGECVPLKLSECGILPQIPIDPEFYLAERLGLGNIKSVYDPFVLRAGRATFTMDNVQISPCETLVGGVEFYLAIDFVRNDGTKTHIVDEELELPDESRPMTPEKLQISWKNERSIYRKYREELGIKARAIKDPSLLPLISQEIDKMRSRAYASLYAPGTSLAIRWQKALDELQASRNLIKAALTVLGHSEKEIERIFLWSGDEMKAMQEEGTRCEEGHTLFEEKVVNQMKEMTDLLQRLGNLTIK